VLPLLTLLIKWKWAIIAGVLVYALVAIVIYVHGAEKAKSRVDVLETLLEDRTAEYVEAMAGYSKNQRSLTQCLAVNIQNASEAEKQKQQAQIASQNIKALRAELKRHTGEIHADSEALRGRDQECRTVDQPLPDWFTRGLHDNAP